MKKISTLFIRNPIGRDRSLVTTEVEPECQWVLDGEGQPTEKFDGSACLFHGGKLYRRHYVKEGKTIPPGWLHWDFDPEAKSGHGWVPVSACPADEYHREALANLNSQVAILEGTTLELVGPSLQRNPYSLKKHILWCHGSGFTFSGISSMNLRTAKGIEYFLASHAVEGIVWHHEDGRMAKIKRKDFGLLWPV